MLNQQPENGNKTRSELAIEKKDEILWFDHYNETFFNIFAKWTLWFGGLERFSYVIRIRVNMMFTVTHLNTCSSTCTRCNYYTQSFHIKLLNSLSHTYFFYNVSVRAVVDATWRNGTEKRQLLGKKYMHFWWKKKHKKFCSSRLGRIIFSGIYNLLWLKFYPSLRWKYWTPLPVCFQLSWRN